MNDTVWGVWIGKHEAELEYLFTTSEAAQQYADEYNRVEVAQMNAHFDAEAAESEAKGEAERAARYRVRRWKPQAWVREHTILTDPRQADTP